MIYRETLNFKDSHNGFFTEINRWDLDETFDTAFSLGRFSLVIFRGSFYKYFQEHIPMFFILSLFKD